MTVSQVAQAARLFRDVSRTAVELSALGAGKEDDVTLLAVGCHLDTIAILHAEITGKSVGRNDSLTDFLQSIAASLPEMFRINANILRRDAVFALNAIAESVKSSAQEMAAAEKKAA